MKTSTLVYSLLGFFLLVRTVTAFIFQPSSRLWAEGEATITITLDKIPMTSQKSQKILIQGLEIIKNRFPEISYGDKVQFNGKIGIAEGKAKMLFPQIKQLENPKKISPVRRIYDFKNWLVNRINILFPEPQAGLLNGILLGEKASLDSSLKQSIQNTGLTHVVVASGTNLTFVAGLVFALGIIIVGRRWANLLALPLIWLYAVMAGFEPPVVRAAIMISFMFLARSLGRPMGAWRGLVIAVYIMILFDPFIITSLGFQLSVAATIGLIISGGGLFKQAIGAQIMTLPLIIGTFGHYGLLSLMANIAVIWAIPFIMIFGLIGLTGFTFPAQMLLSYFTEVVSFFGRFESLVLGLPRIDPIAIFGIYLIIISVYVQRRTTKSVGGVSP